MYPQLCLVVTWLVPREPAAVLVQVLCAPYNHAPVYSVKSFKATYILSMHVCLAVTCHLRCWQNERDLVHATEMKRGWNGYRNKESSQKTKIVNKMWFAVAFIYSSHSFSDVYLFLSLTDSPLD